MAVALIWYHDSLILQLRDFDAAIADPASWGFFGGHLQEGETPADGLRRELREELGWSPDTLAPLGSFPAEEHLVIIGFACCRTAPIEVAALKEGQEIGVFGIGELADGWAYSQRWQRVFPLAPITSEALSLWARNPGSAPA